MKRGAVALVAPHPHFVGWLVILVAPRWAPISCGLVELFLFLGDIAKV